VEKDILKIIQTSRYGLNISQIAKELKLSRNTVKANVELLEKEGTILEKNLIIQRNMRIFQKSHLN